MGRSYMLISSGSYKAYVEIETSCTIITLFFPFEGVACCVGILSRSYCD